MDTNQYSSSSLMDWPCDCCLESLKANNADMLDIGTVGHSINIKSSLVVVTAE